ncbi:MAG: apolipoprotein acyltransferase [Pirellulaceae bacterium]|nr:apolipoprotein acyltransferase [Pirellulaceae bacterium]
MTRRKLAIVPTVHLIGRYRCNVVTPVTSCAHQQKNMSADQLIQRCHQFAQLPDDTVADADSLIGFFQLFRPDGRGIEGLFDDLSCGADLHARLDELEVAAREDRRPQGGLDAYFIVRRPHILSAESVERLAKQWLSKLLELAIELGDTNVAELLQSMPTIRILEGHPPKNPKIEAEKSDLLRAFQERIPKWCEQFADADEHAEALRPAYYFNTCDPMVRDYLMWPLYAPVVEVREPFAAYFELWKHRVKYRIFNDHQIDLYLPRQFASPQ